MMKNLVVIIGFSLAVFSQFAHAGVSTSGGGNFEEADFARRARAIFDALEIRPDISSTALNINFEDSEKALKTVEVQCAYRDSLLKLKDLHKFAYFDSSQTKPTISLDCEQYGRLTALPASSSDIIVFHEYMRSIGRENGDYSASAKLEDVLAKIQIKTSQNIQSPNNNKQCLVNNFADGQEYYICAGVDYVTSIEAILNKPKTTKQMFEYVNYLHQAGVCEGLTFVSDKVCNTNSKTKR